MPKNKNLILPLKVGIGFLWLIILIAVFGIVSIPFAGFFIFLGCFLTVAHLVEIVIFHKGIKNPSDFVQVFFFGVLHLKAMRVM